MGQEARGEHLLVVALDGIAADDLEDPGVVDLEDDIELDVEHSDDDADSKADGDVAVAGHARRDRGDHTGHAVVGSGRAAQARGAHGHELDGAADDEAGVGITQDDTGEPAHKRVHEGNRLGGIHIDRAETREEDDEDKLERVDFHVYHLSLQRDEL